MCFQLSTWTWSTGLHAYASWVEAQLPGDIKLTLCACVCVRAGRWEARIGIPGSKHIYLGLFNLEKEAAQAYDRALVRLRGTAAATNFALSDYRTDLAEYHKMQQVLLHTLPPPSPPPPPPPFPFFPSTLQPQSDTNVFQVHACCRFRTATWAVLGTGPPIITIAIKDNCVSEPALHLRKQIRTKEVIMLDAVGHDVFFVFSCLHSCNVGSLMQLSLMAWMCKSLYLPTAGCAGPTGKQPLLLCKRARDSICKVTIQVVHFTHACLCPLAQLQKVLAFAFACSACCHFQSCQATQQNRFRVLAPIAQETSACQPVGVLPFCHENPAA